MARTGVRVTADSSAFQKEMQKAVQTMKELASQSSLAQTQAKLFGSAQDVLKEKVKGLELQIKSQSDIVALNAQRVEESRKHLQKWQEKQANMQKEIAETEAALKESTEATGENSEETRKLKEQLENLQKEEKKAADQVFSCEKKLSRHTVASTKALEALTELKLELKETNEELKNAAWDEWSKKADKATKTMDSVGKKMSAISASIVGAGTAAVKTTADFDKQMSAVQSISGASAEDMERLRNKALEMGSTTSFSAFESAQALEYMAAAGWKVDQMIDGLPGVLNAAAASGEDLAMTSDILTDGLTAFGEGAGEAERFADVLVATGNASNTNVAMMGETFKYAGAICGTLGISLEDTAVAAGLMANAGIKASQSGTALRAGLTRLVDPTAEASKAMQSYGFQVQKNRDGSVNLMGTMQNLRASMSGLDATTRASALSTIFGTEALSGWSAVVSASDEDFASLTNSIYNCTGAAQKASDIRLDNLSGQVTILKSTIEGIAIDVGDILTPSVKELVANVQRWATAFHEADEDTKKTVITIAAVVAGIGPLTLGISAGVKTVKTLHGAYILLTKAGPLVTKAFGLVTGGGAKLVSVAGTLGAAALPKVTSALGLVTKGLGKVSSALSIVTSWIKPLSASIVPKVTSVFVGLAGKGLSAVTAGLGLIASPAGIVIATLGGLAAAAVYLWKTNETFRDNAKKCWTDIEDFFEEVTENIRGFFDFEWKLPKIKLPHFKLTGSFSLEQMTVPVFSVDWYKTGAIMTAPTIFGMNGRTMLGGGEAGHEAILPLEPFYIRLDRILDEKLRAIESQTIVYVTCYLDGEEITSRQIVKVEKHLTSSSRAIRRATA